MKTRKPVRINKSKELKEKVAKRLKRVRGLK